MLTADRARIQLKFAKIVKLDTVGADSHTKACESCEYSSSSSSSSDSDDEYTAYRMSTEAVAELEIPVWVGDSERWVTGLTKRTTCDDVIYALMTFNDGGGGGGYDAMELQSYALYERWRDVERPLKGRTKLLKVWRAWGSESRNVKFCVKKVENPYESGSEIMRPRRPKRRGYAGARRDADSRASADREARRRERSRRRQDPESARRSGHDRRRHERVTQSMEHIWDDFDMVDVDADAIPAHAKYPSADDRTKMAPGRRDNTKGRFFHELVQLILNQEKQIQEQTVRLRETDAQIDDYETKIHLMRVQKNGRNYVQESYMKDAADCNSGASADEARTTQGIVINNEAEVDAYVELCERILTIQERISQEERKVEKLTMAMFSEIHGDNSDNFSLASGYEGSPPRRASPTSGAGGVRISGDPGGVEWSAEAGRLRKDIERSVALSAAQQKQVELAEETLRQCQVEIRRKTLYVNQLTLELNERQSGVGLLGVSTPQLMSRWRSRSCELLSRAPLLPPLEEVTATEEFAYEGREARPQYSSDSGVESVDNRPEADADAKTDASLSPASDQGFVDDVAAAGATTAAGRKMVPYLTYATYDREAGDRCPPDGRLPVGCGKTSASDDSNSDTGLSSLHSDEPSPVLETLV